jgi:hypothetical protein
MTILPALHSIIGGFVRRTWLVTLVAMVVCGFFAARGWAAYVEADAMAEVAPTAPPSMPKAKPALKRERPDPNIVATRNIFCSVCSPVELGPSNGYAGQPAVLIATSIGAQPRATVHVTSTEVQGSWGVGEEIPGVGTVTRIGGASIEVADRWNHTKTLSLRDAAAGTTTGAATPDGGTPAAPANPFAGRIKKLSDGSYEVDRDVVRELVNMGGQNTGVRAFPIVENKEVKGLRLTQVTATSVASALGLKRGDILSSIDNEPIKTMNQLLELYGKLDKLNGIDLQGTRAGKPLVVSLRFR